MSNINSLPMEALEENPQIVYFHPSNARGASLSLLRFGYDIFCRTSRLQNLNLLKRLSTISENKQPFNFEEVQPIIFNQLLDSIQIVICFENYMKSVLLLNNYVIHKTTNVHLLYKKQFSTPIHLSELLLHGTWEINGKLNLPFDDAKKQIKGLMNTTVGMKELMCNNYQTVINMPTYIQTLITPYVKYRNNLHYYMGEGITLHPNLYDDFIQIIHFVNQYIVGLHNILVRESGMDDSKILPYINFHSNEV